MTYAFIFDASSCTGCKSCQIACVDKNKLPPGVLWRRVFEISGGAWEQHGNAWLTDVFAYNLSIACNHCVHPKCAGVCPTDAYVQRDDGIIYLDVSRCMGCGYCNWACPYGVPQYHPGLGCMTKCNFCMDEVDLGLPPSCVAACPMRVLDYIDTRSKKILEKEIIPLWKIPAKNHPFPLAEFSRTEPHLAIKSHKGMFNSLEKRISNLVEVSSGNTKSNVSLVMFTLLGQTAVGAFLAVQWMFRPLWNMLSFDTMLLQLIPYLIIGLNLCLAGFFSFSHLGAKKNAWMVLAHLRKSWLSREALFAGMFSLGWVASTLFVISKSWQPFINWLMVILGFGLVYSMAEVYRLRSVPTWDSWRTNIGFFITTLLIGSLSMAVVLILESASTRVYLSPILVRAIIIIVTILMVGQFMLQLPLDEHIKLMNNKIRVNLVLVGLVSNLIIFVFPSLFRIWTVVIIFIIVIIEETIGRWLFFELRNIKT